MAKAIKVETKNELTANARKAIALSYCDALAAVSDTGSMINTVCELASEYLKGEKIAKSDSEDIIKQIAAKRGWKKESMQPRCSEVRIVLDVYSLLPEAVKAFKLRAKQCTWHHAMALARKLRKDSSITKAVSAVNSKGTGITVSPQGRAAGALKSLLKEVSKSAAKRDAVRKAIETLVNAGVIKLEI